MSETIRPVGFLAGAAEFFEWLLRSSVQAGVLVVLIVAIQGLLRHRLTPAWRYGLWSIVLIRLILPSLPESGFSVFNLAPVQLIVASPPEPPTAGTAGSAWRAALPELSQRP